MNASIRTLTYAGVAAAFAVAAYGTHVSMQPPDLSGFERVGQKFFPQFDDPEQAVKLRVVSYDDLEERPRPFTVEKDGDQWRIPSHHDYPAEAKQQLAKTAASVINVKREAVASRRNADHERLAVVDPLDEETTAIRGRGKRITLYDKGGKTLIDLIIGNTVEGQTDQYYVRVPTEKETYRSTLSIELSTKFSDWIEPDLLKLSSSDLVSLKFSKPIIEKKVIQTPLGPRVSDVLTGDEKLDLARKDSSADWKLGDLKAATEELDDSPIRDAINALDDLKIVGVRPKPPGINADLKFEFPEEIAGDRARMGEFAQDRMREMVGKGFGLDYDDKQEPYLYSREGKLIAGTEDGVLYHLHFGNRFDGSLEDIEIGGSSAGGDKPAKSEEGEAPPSKEDSKPSAPNANGDERPEEKKKGDQGGRYVLVRVTFDPASIGEEPVEPIKPQKPEDSEETDKPPKKGAKENADPKKETPEKDEADSADDAQHKSPVQPDGEEIPAAKPDNDDKEKSQPDKAGDDDKQPAVPAEYEKALADYEVAKRKYDDDKQDFDDKVEKGSKKVKELNDRFEGWYYVISADSIDKLQLSRDQLVKVKELPKDDETPVEAPDPPSAGKPADNSGDANDDSKKPPKPKE